MEILRLLSVQSDSDQSVVESRAYTRLKVNKYVFRWTVDNISKRFDEVSDALESLTFPTGRYNKLNWRLRLYVKGHEQRSKDYLSLFLKLVSNDAVNVRTQFVFSIINANEEETNAVEFVHRFDTSHRSGGRAKFISRDFLLGNAEELLPHDKLTLFCRLSIFEDIANLVGQNVDAIREPGCHLSAELGKLLVCQKHSDVVLRSADGFDFPGHKAILAARSPVFSDMFEYEMKEKTLGKVEMTDMDHEVLQAMLHYIYTGKVSNMEVRSLDLLMAADKFQLSHLKMLCEDYLGKILSVANAAEFLMYADRHNADKLKALAIVFISRHGTGVMDTPGWREMNQTHPLLVSEVFRCLAEQLESFIGPPQKKKKQ